MVGNPSALDAIHFGCGNDYADVQGKLLHQKTGRKVSIPHSFHTTQHFAFLKMSGSVSPQSK